MEDRVIHASMKSVIAAYVLAVIVMLAAYWALNRYAIGQPVWLFLLPLLALYPPVKMHVKCRLVTLRFHDGHVTLETGFFSRSRRTIDMAKIQDVTVRQSFGQRLIAVGDLLLEDAGESGSLAIRNLDQPREIADIIINGSRRAPNAL